MDIPNIIRDIELEEREGRRPAWWRRALAFTLRSMQRPLVGRPRQRELGIGNQPGAGRDLLTR